MTTGDLICDAKSKSAESGMHTLLVPARSLQAQSVLAFRPPKILLLNYGDETNYTTLNVLSYTVSFAVWLCCKERVESKDHLRGQPTTGRAATPESTARDSYKYKSVRLLSPRVCGPNPPIPSGRGTTNVQCPYA
jgi:hypothetical protein